MVLDRDLPGVHGDEVCRRLAAERSPSRILMLTAAGSLRERVEGLDLGADDYLAKPFDFPELTARVRALGRRAAVPLPPTLACGDIRLDPGGRAASRAGQRLTLSAKEFAVLEYLLASAGRVVSAEELLERVWDEAADPFTTAVKQTICRLRAKLGDPPVIAHRPRGRVPDRRDVMPGLGKAAPVSGAPRLMAVLRIPRLTLRSQLALLYAGLFLAVGHRRACHPASSRSGRRSRRGLPHPPSP